jgi:hypothetical protein
VVSAALQRVFDLRIPLQDIPFDVRVQRLAVDPDGVTLALIGQDLVYST